MTGPIAGRVAVRVLALGLWIGPGLAGCSFGPKALEQTHGRYNESVRRVDEEQLLRNLVRLRYDESPLDLRVSSIAAQYELSGVAEARPFFVAPAPPNGRGFKTFTSVLPDASLTGANRPTITMVPDDDGNAVRRFLTPISADTLVLLTQTSWPVASILRLWVDRLNGVPNAVEAGGPGRDRVPDFAQFRRAADLLQSAGSRGLISVHPADRVDDLGIARPLEAVPVSAEVEAAKGGLRFRPTGDGATVVLGRKGRKLVMEVAPLASGDPELDELTDLLGLRPGLPSYDLVVGQGEEGDAPRASGMWAAELRIKPRSTSQVFFYLSNGVEVPDEHVASGIIRPVLDAEGRPFDWRAVTSGLFCVHACGGRRPPEAAYLAVKYRGYWYYIDDRDRESKATFALVLQLARLDFGRQPPGGPLLTLPVGR